MKKITLFLFIVLGVLNAKNIVKSEFVIAIDIGHLAKYQGATSSRGIGEYQFNQNIALLLLKALHQAKFSKAFIVEEKEKIQKLQDRTQIAQKYKADIFLSIHHDSVQPKYISYWQFKGRRHHYSDKFQGYSLFVSQKNREYKKSVLLAKNIAIELQKNNFIPTLHHAEKIKGETRTLLDRGIYEFSDLIVLKTASMPSVLIECGIIVNRTEEKLLSTPEYQQKIVDSIVLGIERYFAKTL